MIGASGEVFGVLRCFMNNSITNSLDYCSTWTGCLHSPYTLPVSSRALSPTSGSCIHNAELPHSMLSVARAVTRSWFARQESARQESQRGYGGQPAGITPCKPCAVCRRGGTSPSSMTHHAFLATAIGEHQQGAVMPGRAVSVHR